MQTIKFLFKIFKSIQNLFNILKQCYNKPQTVNIFHQRINIYLCTYLKERQLFNHTFCAPSKKLLMWFSSFQSPKHQLANKYVKKCWKCKNQWKSCYYDLYLQSHSPKRKSELNETGINFMLFCVWIKHKDYNQPKIEIKIWKSVPKRNPNIFLSYFLFI